MPFPCRGRYTGVMDPTYESEEARMKEITLAQFADELKTRLVDGKTVDCCKEELLNLADILKAKIPDEKITVNWKE